MMELQLVVGYRQMNSGPEPQTGQETCVGGSGMAFVNEYVDPIDVQKYALEEINQKYWKTDTRYDWTVDRERDIYLRWMKSGRGEFSHQHDFTFYWQGSLLGVRLSRIDRVAEGGPALVWRLYHLALTGGLKSWRAEILEDLKEALRVYQTAGIRTPAAGHVVMFEF
jgi:hypothetical protein